MDQEGTQGSEQQVEPANPPFDENDPFGIEAARREVEESVKNNGQDAASTESQDSGDQTLPETLAPDDAESGDDTSPEDDTKKYSRKDAARLAKQLLEANQKMAEQQAELDKRTQETEALAGKVRQAIGTDEQYKAAMELMKHGSTPQERERGRQVVAVYDQNREFYSQVYQFAESQVFTTVKADFLEASKFEGVDQKVVFGSKMLDVLKHVYEAGKNVGVEPLNQEITRLKAELKGARAGKASSGRAPVEGGRLTESDDWSHLYDPRTGDLLPQALTAAKQGVLAG